MIVVSKLKFFVILLLFFFVSCKKETRNTATDVSKESSKTAEIKLQKEKVITIESFVEKLNKNLKEFDGNYLSKIFKYPIIVAEGFEDVLYDNYLEFRNSVFFYDTLKNVEKIGIAKNPYNKDPNKFFLFGTSKSLNKVITYEVLKIENKFYLSKINVPSEPTDEP